MTILIGAGKLLAIFLIAFTVASCATIKEQAKALKICMPEGEALAACIDKAEQSIKKPETPTK